MTTVRGVRAAGSMTHELRGSEDRGPTWGSLEVWVERYGAVRYRLTVLPPGIDAITGRWVRAWYVWCGVGPLIAAAAALAMTLLLPPAAAFATAGCLYLAGWLVIRRRAGDARRLTRRLIGVDLGRYATDRERERCGRLLRAAATLDEADRAARAGAIAPVDRELVWARVHEEVGRLAAADRRRRA